MIHTSDGQTHKQGAANMETTYFGEQKVILALGRKFAYCEDSHNAVVQVEWAYGKLAEPDAIYPNGKHSHDVAGAVLDQYEDALIEYQLFN
jgi:hypothetical protein